MHNDESDLQLTRRIAVHQQCFVRTPIDQAMSDVVANARQSLDNATELLNHTGDTHTDAVRRRRVLVCGSRALSGRADVEQDVCRALDGLLRDYGYLEVFVGGGRIEGPCEVARAWCLQHDQWCRTKWPRKKISIKHLQTICFRTPYCARNDFTVHLKPYQKSVVLYAVYSDSKRSRRVVQHASEKMKEYIGQ